MAARLERLWALMVDMESGDVFDRALEKLYVLLGLSAGWDEGRAREHAAGLMTAWRSV